jgi:hypothetical protein
VSLRERQEVQEVPRGGGVEAMNLVIWSSGHLVIDCGIGLTIDQSMTK